MKPELQRTSPDFEAKYLSLMTPGDVQQLGTLADNTLLKELAKDEGIAQAFPTNLSAEVRAVLFASIAQARYWHDVACLYKSWLADAPGHHRMKLMNHIARYQMAAEAAGICDMPSSAGVVNVIYCWLEENHSSDKLREALGYGRTAFKSAVNKLQVSLRGRPSIPGRRNVPTSYSRAAALSLLELRLVNVSRVKRATTIGNIITSMRPKLRRGIRPLRSSNEYHQSFRQPRYTDSFSHAHG